MHVTLIVKLIANPVLGSRPGKPHPAPPRERQSLVNYAAGSCGRDWSNIYVTSSIPATFGAQNLNIYK